MTPGGGVLKIKLSKKKPIKITAGAPDGEPDPALTKVKTVQDPIDRKDGQPPSSLRPGVVVNAEQPKEKKIPPVRASQPMLRMGEEERSNIPPRRMGGPSGSGNVDPGRNGGSYGHGKSLHRRRERERDGNSPMKGNPQEERNPQGGEGDPCLLYTSPSPRDATLSRMPSSA